MTTLRRELRTKFQDVLNKHMEDAELVTSMDELCDELADTAIELRGFKMIEGAGVDWAILAGEDITEGMVKEIQLRDLAPKMFEKALGFSKPLPWWSNKSWTSFGEWVCAEWNKSKISFGEYNIWRNTPYTKGGLSNTRLRGFVNEFYDSWDMFRMSQPKKTDEARPEYKTKKPQFDDHGRLINA